MKERKQLVRELDELQQEMKELEIRYEQYFAGVEKREPYHERKDLARKLRQYNTRRIIQTDVKYRHQGLLSRFMTYSQYWDRILRMIDEGKYHRHLAKKPSTPPMPSSSRKSSGDQETEELFKQLIEARKQSGDKSAAPSREKVSSFIRAQREKIREKFGDKPIEFLVDTSAEKPRIKVRLKKA